MKERYRVLQVQVCKGDRSIRTNLNVVTSNIDLFRKDIHALTEADTVRMTYEEIPLEEYLEPEETIL